MLRLSGSLALRDRIAHDFLGLPLFLVLVFVIELALVRLVRLLVVHCVLLVEVEVEVGLTLLVRQRTPPLADRLAHVE